MIGNNTAFGRSGSHDFKLQRYSAFLLMIYLGFIILSLFNMTEFTFINWSAIFAPLWVKLFTLAAVTAISVHAWAGLWIVSTDYLKPPAIRNLFQLFVLLMCLGFIAWTALIFWG